MTVYAPTHLPTMPLPGVEPAVLCLPVAKGTGGLTYSIECPWDNVKVKYANATVTTAIVTEALVITVRKASTSLYTVTTGATDAIGTQVDGVLVSNSTSFARGDTITVTTTNSTNAGAAFLYIFLERSR